MIARFSVGNFLSFKETHVINFEATSLKDSNQALHYNSENPSSRLLKSVSIQGFNSSGKSNILKAFSFMKFWVINSFSESNKVTNIPIQPFLLEINSKDKVSTFEVIFFILDIKYRYGFKLTREKVDEEWLFYSEPKKREQSYFVRKGEEIELNNSWKRSSPVKIDPVISFTKPIVLFISALGQFNIEIGNLVIQWFNKNLVAFDLSDDYHINKTASLLNDQEYFIAIHELISNAKLGFKSFNYSIENNSRKSTRFENDFLEFALQDVGDYKIETKHDVFDEDHNKKGQAFFDLRKQESTGTQKFFAIAGAILYGIKNRQILWVDELDSKFHPLLFETIVKSFNSHKFNHVGAQLIFTTHNTHLLKDKFLRRDQIYTVTKNEFGESRINCAARSNARVDISFETQYFDGKFGGIQKINLEDSQLDLFGNLE